MRITRWFKNGLLAVLGVSSAAGFSACTNAGGSKTTSVKLTLPDPNVAFTKARSSLRVGALSLTQKSYYSRIMINIQGGGVPAPIVHIQEIKDPSQPINLNPQFEVLRGTTPNIQVLLITSTIWVDASTGQPISGSDHGEEKFYYGDAMNVAMQSDLQKIPLSVSAMGVTQGAQGAIAGRLIDSDGTGVTGKVAIKIVPSRLDGSQAPPMIVSQTEIHGGWFEFIAFQGLKFSYVFDDGTPNGRDLLPGLNIDTVPTAGALPQNQAFITVPSAYRSLSSSGTEIQRTSWPGARFWIGFFGAGAPATHKACYDSGAGANMSYLYSSSAVGDTTQIQWAGASPDATHAGVASGGIGVSNGDCDTAANAWNSWLKPMPLRLADGHGVLGSRGPFRTITGSNGGPVLLDTVHDGVSSLTLKWGYLPGAAQGGRIDGVGVFRRVLPTAPSNNGGGRRDYEVDDLIACNKLTDPNFFPANGPFQLVTQVPVTAALTQTTTLSGINSSDFNSGKVQVILCPYSSGKTGYYNAGIDMNSGGGGSGPGPATKLTVVGPSVNPALVSDVIATNVCSPLMLVPQDSNGRPTWMPPSPSLAMTSTGQATFYADALCQNALTANNAKWDGASGNSTATVFIKTTSASAFSVSAHLTASASSYSPAINVTGHLSLAPATPGSVSQYKILGLPSALTAFTCYPVMAVALDITGRIVVPGATPMSFPSVGTSNLFVYGPDDGMCVSASSLVSKDFYFPLPSPSPAMATGFVPLYLRYVGTSALATATNILNGIMVSSMPVVASNATVALPGAAAKLKVMMPGSFAAEQCMWASIKLVDSSGNETPAPAGGVAVSANTNSGSAQFYPDYNCNSVSSAGPASVTIPEGATQALAYFREPSSNATSFTASASGGIASGTQPLSVSGPQVAKLVVTGPGQSYSAGGVSGADLSINHGSAVAYTVTALSILDNPVNPGAMTFNIGISQPGAGTLHLNGQSGGISVSFGTGNTTTVNLDCSTGGSYPITLTGGSLMAPAGSPYAVISNLTSLSCD